MSKSRKTMSAGVGDSRTFAAEKGSFEERPQQHIDGRPIGGGVLDHLVASTYSDEGIAEKEALPKARTQVVRDAFEKQAFDQRRDFRATSTEPWEAPNLMSDLMKQHVPAGHRGRFLSDRKVQGDGMRGWQPVVDERGDPVRFGNMTLGSMPEAKARQRNAHYRGRDAERIKTIYEQQSEQTLEAGLRPFGAGHQRDDA